MHSHGTFAALHHACQLAVLLEFHQLDVVVETFLEEAKDYLCFSINPFKVTAMPQCKSFLPVTILSFLANLTTLYSQNEFSETLRGEVQRITDSWQKLAEQHLAKKGTLTCKIDSDNESLMAKGRGVLLRGSDLIVWYVGDSANQCKVAMVANSKHAFQVGLTDSGDKAIYLYRDFSKGESPYSNLEFRNATVGANSGFLTFPPLFCSLHELAALLPFASIQFVSEHDLVRTLRITLDQNLMKEKVVAEVRDFHQAKFKVNSNVSKVRSFFSRSLHSRRYCGFGHIAFDSL
jgi:hypothetical protein